MNSARAHRPRTVPASLAALLFAGAAFGPGFGAQAADVLIYRCTDDRGQLSLRDTPCANGQRQQTVTMARPVDPPPRVVEASVAPPPRPVADPRPRVLVVQTAQPMYDCVRPDGSTYTSSNGDGNPRSVPIVDLGYGVPFYNSGTSLGNRVGARTPQLGEASARIAVSGRHSNVTYAATARSGSSYYQYPGGYDYGYGVYYGTQLIRDECRQLPQQEICSRLRDERYSGDRRYNSALQSERDQITKDQRVIDARLNSDCGAY